MNLAGMGESLLQIINNAFSAFLFYKIAGFDFIVLWLLGAALFFTLALRFVNIRLFGHAIDIVRGKYDQAADSGEINHFQALCAAISGTVGLGSIAGISVAVAVGGPGAVFWVVLAGLFAMSSKYAEVVLSLSYRRIDNATSKVYGGPFHYIRHGLAEINMPVFGKYLAIVFAFFCMGGALGGGNMFQSNQSVKILVNTFHSLEDYKWIPSLLIAGSVFLVLIGSIKRVAKVTNIVTPLKGVLYICCCLLIIAVNAGEIPAALASIFSNAFSGEAAAGGLIGMLAIAFKRASFANEAGLGSAPITHAAAKTTEPVREGAVALLEPFFAAIIALMTGLTVVVTKAYVGGTLEDGVLIAARAFETVGPWFPILLTINVLIFAYGCILGWSYYGEMAWTYLFGQRGIRLYQLLFCTATFFGGIMHFGLVLDFSDLLILGMGVPNLIAVYLLTPRIIKETNSYIQRLKTGVFDKPAQPEPAPASATTARPKNKKKPAKKQK
ncbi:amino acid carrier protein [bacterium]|nr:amino acid carrier protein [bacterium]